MGKVSLLTVVALLAGVSWFQLSVSESEGAEARRRAKNQFDTLARDAAHTGFAVAAERVTSGLPGSLSPIGGDTENGTYETVFTERGGSPREVIVRSEGRAGGARHVVEALFREEGSGPSASAQDRLEQLPPHLRYAIFSGSTLRLSALPRVRSGADSVNADVHANRNLSLALSVGSLLGLSAVEGFGTYGGRLVAPPLLSKPDRAFRPLHNPDGLTPLRRKEPVSARAFDADAVAADHRALGREIRTVRGQIRLGGRVELGTREAPKVMVIDGDLALVDVSFDGYGVILVKGSLVVDATVTGLVAALTGRPEGEVVVAAEGPVVFNGAGDVQGHYVTNGSALIAGAATLHGGVTAMGSVDVVLAPTIRYVPPAPALTVGLPGSVPQSIRRVSMREWEGPSDR